MQQERFGFRPLAPVGQYLRDIDPRERGVDGATDSQECVSAAFVIGQRLVPTTFPLADDAKALQHRGLTNQITRFLIRLERLLHPLPRAFPAQLTIRPSHDEIRFAECFRIVRGFCFLRRPIGPFERVVRSPFSLQHRGAPCAHPRGLARHLRTRCFRERATCLLRPLERLCKVAELLFEPCDVLDK